MNYNNIGALNQFAANDASLRRNNIRYAGQMAGQLQSQQNLATQAAIQRRIMLEQAYGRAMQAGLNNIVGGVQGGVSVYEAGKKGGDTDALNAVAAFM